MVYVKIFEFTAAVVTISIIGNIGIRNLSKF